RSYSLPLLHNFLSHYFRGIFSQVSADDLSRTYWLLNQKSGELSKLDFILVFASGKLDFDDIARYGGLYSDEIESPLAPLQSAMESAESSVWGKMEGSSSFIEDISHFTYTSPLYLPWPADPNQLRKNPYNVNLVVVELLDSWDPETSLSEHGAVIGHVMKSMDDLGANYAAFYGTITRHQNREKRSSNMVPPHILSALKNTASNETAKQVCNRTAIIYEQTTNQTDVKTTFCSLLCMRSTVRAYLNVTGNDTAYEPLLAVYWPSWVYQQDMKNNESDIDKGIYPPNYHCNMTGLEFDETEMYCQNSSIQEEYLSQMNLTSNSVTAYLKGNCGVADDTENITEIMLKVEFIFFGGGSDVAKKPKGLPFAPLPGKQLLMPGYWTMQLVVTNVTNVTDDKNNASHYLTRYRTNIDLSKRNSSGSPIVEKRGLFYPFSIPFYVSYSCVTHKDRLWHAQGNLNRFVPTKLPFNASSDGLVPLDVADGPVLQFVGFQVQSYGNVYGAHNETRFLAFSTVYDCEGYFDVASWMGTFVTVIFIIVLYFAILALFSTQTVDRFDDPRSRTISVENLH
ncbi:hypothetical protein GBAR_LOCUS15765, partial [Geodia barretti]